LRTQPGTCRAQPSSLSIGMALGAALVAEWNTLDTELQRKLFRRAADSASETALLRQQIARFLHDHKDDEATAGEPAEGATTTPRADR
jgi:hypothetical protein